MGMTKKELLTQIEALRDEVGNGAITATRLGVILENITGWIETNFAALENGKIPSSQLPSFVDEIVEVASKSALPSTGKSGVIYVAMDTNIIYRWTGTAYVEIASGLALGETSSTAYPGNLGAANASSIASLKEWTTEVCRGHQTNISYIWQKLNTIDEGAQKNVGVEYTEEEKAKLSEIEAGAQKNPDNVVSDADYVHTDNNYTNSDKEKVTNLSDISSISEEDGTTKIENDTVDILATTARVNGESIVTESEIQIATERVDAETEEVYQSSAEYARSDSANVLVISGASGDITVSQGTVASDTRIYRDGQKSPIFHLVPVNDYIGYMTVVDSDGNSFGHENTDENEIWFSLDEIQGKTITVTAGRTFVILLKTACYVTVTHESGSVEYKSVTEVVKENMARLDTMKNINDTLVLTGSSASTPNATEVAAGTQNDVSGDSASVSVTTASTEGKKCHWVAVKASSPYRVTEITDNDSEDNDGESLLDDVRFLMIGNYYVWVYLSTMNISNTTKFSLTKY